MSSDRLSEIHEVIKHSLRQEILLRLGKFDRLDFEGLKKELKLADSAGLSSQLEVLQELTVEGEHLVTLQGSFYGLTEKGHYVLYELLACPDLAADDYKEKLFGTPQQGQSKVKPRWFTPYWAFLFVSTVIVVGFVIPYFGNQSFSKAFVYLLISLGILGFAYYARVRPSVALNKFVYIVVLGFTLGCALWMLGLITAVFIIRVPHTEAAEDTLFVVLTTSSFTLGPIIGYLIGKARNFKGPQKYSP